jgi:hypothetical protein
MDNSNLSIEFRSRMDLPRIWSSQKDDSSYITSEFDIIRSKVSLQTFAVTQGRVTELLKVYKGGISFNKLRSADRFIENGRRLGKAEQAVLFR